MVSRTVEVFRNAVARLARDGPLSRQRHAQTARRTGSNLKLTAGPCIVHCELWTVDSELHPACRAEALRWRADCGPHPFNQLPFNSFNDFHPFNQLLYNVLRHISPLEI